MGARKGGREREREAALQTPTPLNSLDPKPGGKGERGRGHFLPEVGDPVQHIPWVRFVNASGARMGFRAP